MEETIKKINYRNDYCPNVEVITELYKEALLNRPNDDLDRITRMYKGSNIVITAWDGERLVGILRGWTDKSYDGYICDLAILPKYQKAGIGKELLSQVISNNPKVQFVLRASVIAGEYYKHIGWEKIENGWVFPRE